MSVFTSLRDEMAKAAMQGMLSDHDTRESCKIHADKEGRSFAEEIAQQAYDMADAMLAERNKGE